jgi:hypothetical protein
MKITVSALFPPIPSRSFDYCAIDSDSYDASYEGEDENGSHWRCSPSGHGATEAEAIADLFSQLEEATPLNETISESLDRLFATALRIAEERNAFKSECNHLRQLLNKRLTVSDVRSAFDVALEVTSIGDGRDERQEMNFELLTRALNDLLDQN